MTTNSVQHFPLPSKSHPAESVGVTELILANNSIEQLNLVLPMIAYLTQQQSERWVTWITDRPFDKKLLTNLGINTKVFRIINCADKQSLLWITWEALSAGTSHTVVADVKKLSENEIHQLEQAAKTGMCQGLLLRIR